MAALCGLCSPMGQRRSPFGVSTPWDASVSPLANGSCSHRGLLRLRDAVTDACSHLDIFNCAASMRPRRFLGCGSPGPNAPVRGRQRHADALRGPAQTQGLGASSKCRTSTQRTQALESVDIRERLPPLTDWRTQSAKRGHWATAVAKGQDFRGSLDCHGERAYDRCSGARSLKGRGSRKAASGAADRQPLRACHAPVCLQWVSRCRGRQRA